MDGWMDAFARRRSVLVHGMHRSVSAGTGLLPQGRVRAKAARERVRERVGVYPCR